MSFDLKIGDYSMRPITKDDLEALLEWRNLERIHSMVLTDPKIVIMILKG